MIFEQISPNQVRKNDKYEDDLMTNEKLVAFTFDDGPMEYSEESTAMNILRTLEQYGQRATFFYVGGQINEDTKKEIEFAQSIGCEAGNHSYSHGHLNESSKEEVEKELARTTELLEKYTRKKPVLARIPYLEQSDTILNGADFPLIACSVDSGDWAKASTEEIIKRIMDADANGDLENAVVLLHEHYETTMQAVKILIPDLMEKGYRFVTVSELARHNGIALESHKVYEKIESAKANS